MFILEKTYVGNVKLFYKLNEVSNLLNNLGNLSLTPEIAKTIAKTKLQPLADMGLYINLVNPDKGRSVFLVFSFIGRDGIMQTLSRILCDKSDVSYLNDLKLVPKDPDKRQYSFMTLEGKLTPTLNFSAFKDDIKKLLETSDVVKLKYAINDVVKTYSDNKCRVSLDNLIINCHYGNKTSLIETIINLLVKVTDDVNVFTSSVTLYYKRRNDDHDLIENEHIGKCTVDPC